jgi:hypothetical protein
MNNDFPAGQPPLNPREPEHTPPGDATRAAVADGVRKPPGDPDASSYERVKPYLLVDPSPRPGAFSDADILNRGPRAGFEGVPAAAQMPNPPPVPVQRAPMASAPASMPAAPTQHFNPSPPPSSYASPQPQINPPPPTPPQTSVPPAYSAPVQQPTSMPLQRFNPPPASPPAPAIQQPAPPPAQAPAPSAPALRPVSAPPAVSFSTHSAMPVPAHPPPPQPPAEAAPSPGAPQMPSGVIGYGVSPQPNAPLTATPMVNNGPATQTHIASNVDMSDLVDAVFVEVTRQNSGPRRG